MRQGRSENENRLMLDRARKTLEASLEGTCTIERAQQTETEMGGRSVVYASPYELRDIKCGLFHDNGKKAVTADQLGSDGGYEFHLPQGTDVRPKDRIVYNSQIFFVNEVAQSSGDLLVTVKAKWIE